MIGVIIGARKVGINPDNIATPIAASLGDLITLSLLAGISSTLFKYIGTESLLNYWTVLTHFWHVSEWWFSCPSGGKMTTNVVFSRHSFSSKLEGRDEETQLGILKDVANIDCIALERMLTYDADFSCICYKSSITAFCMTRREALPHKATAGSWKIFLQIPIFLCGESWVNEVMSCWRWGDHVMLPGLCRSCGCEVGCAVSWQRLGHLLLLKSSKHVAAWRYVLVKCSAIYHERNLEGEQEK